MEVMLTARVLFLQTNLNGIVFAVNLLNETSDVVVRNNNFHCTLNSPLAKCPDRIKRPGYSCMERNKFCVSCLCFNLAS